MRRTTHGRSLSVGDYVKHPTKGRGIVVSMSEPPFALHFVEPWEGRGKPPTVFTEKGFMAPSLSLSPTPRPLPYLRRTRRA